MSYRHDPEKSGFAKRRQGLDIAVEPRLERLLGLPVGMLRRHGSHPIHRKHDLEIHRLLRPQCSVMVKSCDPIGGCDIIGTAFAGHALDKFEYRLLAGPVIPGRERFILCRFTCVQSAATENCQQAPGDDAHHSSSHLIISPTCYGDYREDDLVIEILGKHQTIEEFRIRETRDELFQGRAIVSTSPARAKRSGAITSKAVP